MSRSKRTRRKEAWKPRDSAESTAVATAPEREEAASESSDNTPLSQQPANGTKVEAPPSLPEAFPASVETHGDHPRLQDSSTPSSTLLPQAVPFTMEKQSTLAEGDRQQISTPAPLPPSFPVSAEHRTAPEPVTERQAQGPDPAVVMLIEQRFHKLEALIARLQDTRDLEERVVQRVSSHVDQDRTRESVAALATVGKQILPVAARLLQPEPTSPGKPPGNNLRMPWLLWQYYDEGRTMIRMFFDKRYRLSWAAWLAPITVLFLMLLSYYTIGSIPVVGWIPDKLIDLMLAFFLYKVLIRETERYRQTVG